MRIVKLAQRSPEWLAWRSQGIGGSDAPAVVGLSPWTTRGALLGEKKGALLGAPPRSFDSGAMARGRRLEPVVGRLYRDFTGWDFEDVCAEHDTLPFVRASFDGWVRDINLPVEIKCPNRQSHEQALSGVVPAYYVPQCHHLMAVAGSTRLHYVSYSDYFPAHKRLAVVTLRAASEELAALLAAEAEFWDEVTQAVA